MPPYGQLNQPLPIKYSLVNHTASVQQVSVVTEASDAFMFAGLKSLRVCVLPRQSHVLTFNLFPLACGKLPLPRCALHCLAAER